MKRLLPTVLLCLMAPSAHADKPDKADKSKKPATPSPALQTEPTPGACVYSQPGVKICAPLPDGQGAFDVFTQLPAFLFIRFEDPITDFIAPDPRFFQSDKKDNSITILPTKDSIPERTPAIVSTRTLTVTLNIRPGSKQKVDTQVTIKDPLRAQRNAQMERILAEAEKTCGPRAEERATTIIMDEIVQTGLEHLAPSGTAIARNDLSIVVRVKEVIRFGSRRFLVFTVQNRSRNDFAIKSVRLWVGDREAAAPWRMAKLQIPPIEEVRGLVALAPAPPHAGPTRIKLRIEEADPRRNVEVAGVEIP